MRMAVVVLAGALIAIAGCEQANRQAVVQQGQPKKGGVIQDGSAVSMDYTLTVDGQVVDSSKERGPLTYKQGQRQIIPGLEKQLAGMKAGEHKLVTVEAKEGYGEVDPGAEQKVPRTMVPKDIVPAPGMMLGMTTPAGQQVPVKIKAVDDQNVTIDLNHPLAGKTLTFDVTIVKVE
jgi:FKBP-type peptidyl-prolyl cis-trans isomerase SlyD